jgi:hypothetical protein
MRRSHVMIVGTAAAVLALGYVALAEAETISLNRNPEPDVVAYRALTCNTSATCDPTTPTPALDLAQPATGRPSKLIPTALSGRIAYKAEDAVGNQSPPSVAIPFRGAALSAPTGPQVLP